MADTAQTDKPVVYLSGPMTGYEEWNFPAFNRAARRLRDAGFAVINPAENIGGEANMTAQWFLGLDITMIVTRANLIVLLPGWTNSSGAKVELHVAHAIGLPAFLYRPAGQWPLGERVLPESFSVGWTTDAGGHPVFNPSHPDLRLLAPTYEDIRQEYGPGGCAV